MALIALAGFAAGTIVAILAVLAEHSRIGIGAYALYGNGAIIVLALLAPWALYWGWTWVIARGGRGLEMALFVLGLHFGVGMAGVVDTVVYPQLPGITILDAVPGFALSGTIWVLPSALLAALVYRLFVTRIAINAFTVFVAGFIAAVLVVAYWIGLGILTGMCVAAFRKDPSRRVPVGIALFVLLLVIGNLPFFPAFFAPEPTL